MHFTRFRVINVVVVNFLFHHRIMNCLLAFINTAMDESGYGWVAQTKKVFWCFRKQSWYAFPEREGKKNFYFHLSDAIAQHTMIATNTTHQQSSDRRILWLCALLNKAWVGSPRGPGTFKMTFKMRTEDWRSELQSWRQQGLMQS